MINVSNEYKSIVADHEIPPNYTAKANIVLSNGTVLDITDANIVMGGLKIDDATSDSNKFQLGAAIINQCTLQINNIDDEFSNYDFSGAVIRPYVGLIMSETTEWIPKGVFTSNEFPQASSIITITALDNMNKFDNPFKNVSITFPCTHYQLLEAVCNHCGVILATATFLNSEMAISSRPVDDAVNCREVISWIAMNSRNFARVNTSGQLELKWYDFEAFELQSVDGGTFDGNTPYSSGDILDGGMFSDYTSGDSFDGGTFIDANRYHHIFSLTDLNVPTDDVVITGVQVTDNTDDANTVLFGTTGYIISITGNQLIQSLADATAIANTVGSKIVGMRFRPLSITALSDPSREAGDIAYITDRRQNTYQSFLSNVTFKIGTADKLSCDAESKSRNNSKRYSAATKAIVEARKNTETKLTAYNLLVQQMTALIAGGYGLYKTDFVDQSGGTIYYLHDKPTMAESAVRWFTTSEGMLEQNNVNGTWVTVSGTDKQGNALYNTLTARKIVVDILIGEKLRSNNGDVLIDMAYGVANSDNFSFIDNIQDGFPLTMPFNIDDSVSKINKVLLKFTQQNFRTYSDIASNAGAINTTSGASQTLIATTQTYQQVLTEYAGAEGGSTGDTAAFDGESHSHSFSVSDHRHYWTGSHAHGIEDNGHNHTIITDPHTHELNFGIKEQAISNNEITVYVDSTLRATTSDLQGIIDLTEFVTTSGWHTIEIRTATLKRISAQINIKSYIRS